MSIFHILISKNHSKYFSKKISTSLNYISRSSNSFYFYLSEDCKDILHYNNYKNLSILIYIYIYNINTIHLINVGMYYQLQRKDVLQIK